MVKRIMAGIIFLLTTVFFACAPEVKLKYNGIPVIVQLDADDYIVNQLISKMEARGARLPEGADLVSVCLVPVLGRPITKSSLIVSIFKEVLVNTYESGRYLNWSGKEYKQLATFWEDAQFVGDYKKRKIKQMVDKVVAKML